MPLREHRHRPVYNIKTQLSANQQIGKPELNSIEHSVPLDNDKKEDKAQH
jgi:hypothetical protein